VKALELLEMVESAGLVGNGIEMQKIVQELGGWDVVLNAWIVTGGRAEAFAHVWNMVVHLSEGRDEFATRMNVDPDTVTGYVEALQAMTVTKRAGEVETALSELCLAMTAGYDDLVHARFGESRLEAQALAAWWRARFEQFSQAVLSAS
jgi:hypothetical protein